MAKKSKYTDIATMSSSDLREELVKVETELFELSISLRSNQSNELKKYHDLKRKRAHIKTAMTNHEASQSAK